MAEREPNPFQWWLFMMGIVCFLGAVFLGLDGTSTYTPLLLPLTYFGCAGFVLGTWIHLKS